MAKNKFFKEIHDGVLYEAAESFDTEISIRNKEEEAKTVEKSRFVELSKEDLTTCKIYTIKQIKTTKPTITL